MRVASVLACIVCACAGGAAQRSGDLDAARRFIAAGAPDRAVEILKDAAKAHPDDADVRLLLGTALAMMPRRAEALEALRRGVELRPDSAQGHLMLGNALAKFGESGEARLEFEKAVALDPRLAMAHANLAVILASEHELASAASHLSRAIELQGEAPDSARYYYLRGKVYHEQQASQKARQDFDKAVRLRPDYAQAYFELGLTRADLHDDVGALAALEKAVALEPDDADAQRELGASYLRAGDAKRAVAHLQAAARLRPDDRDVLYALARALRADGRMEEAEPLMRRLSEAAQEQAVHDSDVLQAGELNNAGIALEREGQFTAALEKYRAALKISPQEVRFRRNLALVLCRLERWPEAIVELKEVLRAAPGDPDATRALYIAMDKTHESRP
jgi:tetratricopeptide (TPR) repeat protein